ncbi:MAG: DUF177 domain-containing protein [Chloroflexi bacterium]|nr:DUF177 domain-containing protein [Chloroflexota bacterium]
MYINVSSLTWEPNGSTGTFEIEEHCALLEQGEPRRVSGSVAMLRTDQGIWVSASLDTDVTSTCGRCLAEYVQPVHVAIEEEFLLEVDANTRTRMSRPEDAEQYFYIGTDHILDLTEAARQYVTLNMPMKPVCREDCAGMCIKCGANLNEALCRCDRAPADARWAALSTLVSGGEQDL